MTCVGKRDILLGLDVSTATIGFSLAGPGEIFPILGYVSISDHENLYTRVDEFERAISEKLKDLDLTDRIKSIYIEEDLQRFTPGMSSAKTIQKLSRFNGMISLTVYKMFGIFPVHINVNEARNSIGCKFNRKDKTKTTKQKVFEWVETQLPDFCWPTKVVQSGKRKGQTVNIDECFDMADAYVISRSGALQEVL